MEELVARIGGGSPERDVETQELIDFIAWAKRAGVQRVIVNGSYVTAMESPNDVDILMLPGIKYPRGETALKQELVAWPFLHILVVADDLELAEWSAQHFGVDRILVAKGVVEVLL